MATLFRGLMVTTAVMRAPLVRLPCSSKTTSAPPLWVASCSWTRSGGSTAPQQIQVALARNTVPLGTSLSDSGSNISKSARSIGGPCHIGAQSLTAWFPTQPEGTHERNLRAAVGRFAAHCPCPQVGDGRRAVGVFGVEFSQLLLGFGLDLRTYLA